MTTWRVLEGDCIAIMATLEAESVDAIVTDPPYGLEFMGKDWDRFRLDDPGTGRHRGERAGTHGELITDGGNHPARGSHGVAFGGGKRPSTFRCRGCGKRDQFRNDHDCPAGAPHDWRREHIDPFAAPPTMLAFQNWTRTWALQAWRVLKPGGHLLAFGGTRTYHRLASGLEDAGFEIRDTVCWLHGQGFPKSMDIPKAVDKSAGEVGTFGDPKTPAHAGWIERGRIRGPLETTKEGSDGWRSPWMEDEEAVDRNAREYIPATEDAKRWLGWGTALKPAFEPIVVARKPPPGALIATVLEHGTGALNIAGTRLEGPDLPWSQSDGDPAQDIANTVGQPMFGREPEAVTVVDVGRWPANVIVDDAAAAAIDEQTGDLPAGVASGRSRGFAKDGYVGGSGSEYNGPPIGYGDGGGASRFFYCPKADTTERNIGLPGERNRHPTVKPVALMQWLVRLVTPPDGTVLDPFVGSGTTGMAAMREGFSFVGIEQDPEFVEVARQRVRGDGPLFNLAAEAT